MIARNTALSEFIQAHKAVVDTLPLSPVKTFFDRCHVALSKPGVPITKDISNLQPVCKYIPESLKLASNQGPVLKQLSTKFQNL